MERDRRERGAALVAVLWGTTLIALLAASASGLARQAVGAAAGAIAEAQARHAAEGGIHLAMLSLTAGSDAAVHVRTTIGDIEVTVQVIEEAGKIDLNAAPVELIAGALKVAGAGDDGAQRIASAIADWRDGNRLRRLNGAEENDYRAAGLPYGPRDGLFRSVDELALVLGMDDALFAAARPLVTVHNRHAGIAPAVASRGVLLALPGADAVTVERWLERRGAGGAHLPPPAFTTRWRRGATGERYVTVHAEAESGDSRVALEALVGLAREQRLPTVIEWRTPDEERV